MSAAGSKGRRSQVTSHNAETKMCHNLLMKGQYIIGGATHLQMVRQTMASIGLTGVWGGGPSGVQEQSPWSGGQGVKPLKPESFGLSTSNGSGKLLYFLYFENAEGHDYLQCLSTIIGLVQWAGNTLQRVGPIYRPTCICLYSLGTVYLLAVRLHCLQVCNLIGIVDYADRNKSPASAEMSDCMEAVWRHSRVMAERLAAGCGGRKEQRTVRRTVG